MGKVNYVIIKVSLNAFSFILIDLNIDFIKQYVYSCTLGPITYETVIYLPITGQRTWMEAKLKELTPDGNTNPLKQMKKTKNWK